MDLALAIVTGVSITIALVSLLVAYRSLATGTSSIQTLNTVRDQIATEFNRVRSTNEDTQSLISRIARLFDASEREGLEMMYPNRMEALREFGPLIEREGDEVVIVGCSLLGLSLYVTGFEDIVRQQPNKFKIILTHTDESSQREGPEGRGQGRIGDEITECIQRLQDWGVPIENIQLFRGAPTVFMITASGHMLLNPYPYSEAAYRCFCVQVSSRGSIYAQYFENHYQKIWDSPWIEKGSAFLERLAPAGEE